MTQCSTSGCTKKAITENKHDPNKKFHFCKEHAQKAGLPGFTNTKPKREVLTTINIVVIDDQYEVPCCEEHGAMNRVSKDRRFYRCTACGIGVEIKEKTNQW